MSAEVIAGRVTDAARWREDFDGLYHAHREPVFRYLRAMTGNGDDAIDLTAVVFERAWTTLERRRGDIGLGWLIRTARNAAVDAARRRHAAERALQRADPTVAAPSPEEAAIDAERAGRLVAAVSALPLPQRDAIALRYGTDLTVREIASLIGKSEAATQKLIVRGLALLKERLHDLD